MAINKVALVTGGNRGLGFETCRVLGKHGYHVILTARDKVHGQQKADELNDEGLSIEFHPLDVTDPQNIEDTIRWVEKKHGRLDVLINNAAILWDHDKPIDKELLTKTLETNTIAPYLLCEYASKLMAKHAYGRIVNVSSMSGQLSALEVGIPAYSLSKTALNAVTVIFASKLANDNILVNSVCPGWVNTDMGGASAPLTVQQGVDTIVWAAELPASGPTGKFLQRRKEIAW